MIIVDHGTGISGVAEDKQFGWPVEEWLTPKDLRNAIPSKVDVIVMRACLMGMIEVAHEFQGKADFYVASQTTQHGDAFGPQEFGVVIPKVTDATTPRQARTDLPQTNTSSYSLASNRARSPSCLCRNYRTWLTRSRLLGQALREQMTTEKAVLNAVRQSVQRIDMDANGVNDSADEYIDLRDFAKLVEQKTAQPTVASVAAAVKYAVDQVVKDHYQRGGPWKGYVGDTLVNNTTYYTNTNGISIFFPSYLAVF